MSEELEKELDSLSNTDKVKLIYKLACDVTEGIEEDDGSYSDEQKTLLDKIDGIKSACENL
jgi:hypothetical protein